MIEPTVIHGRTVSAIFVCLLGIGYGIYLIWQGLSRNISRGLFSGEPAVPVWVYAAGGVLLAGSCAAAIIAMLWFTFS